MKNIYFRTQTGVVQVGLVTVLVLALFLSGTYLVYLNYSGNISLDSQAKKTVEDCPDYFNNETCGKKKIDGADECKAEITKKSGEKEKQNWFCCDKDEILLKKEKICCDESRVYKALEYDKKLGWKQDLVCCPDDLDNGECPDTK